MESTISLFADTRWSAEDLTGRWKVSLKQAEEILEKHEARLSEVMCMAGWEYLEIEAMRDYEERDEDDEDDPTPEESVADILAERKVAFARWSFAKPDFQYQGECVSLCGGPNQDEIEHEGVLYEALDQVLDAIDEVTNPPDIQAIIQREWRAWLKTDEARRVHLGQQTAR